MVTSFLRGFRAHRLSKVDHADAIRAAALQPAVRSVVELLESRVLLTASVWNNLSSASPSWNTSANWTPSTSYPSTSSDSANLNVAITTNEAIALGANITVNSLTLGDSALSGGVGNTETISAGDALTFDNGSSAASLTLASGAVAGATIAAPISLNSNLTITNNSSQVLTLSGNIDTRGFSITVAGSGNVVISGAIGNSTGSGTVIQSGSGTLTLFGSSSYSGGTTVNGGVLSIAGNANLGATPSNAVSNNITLNGGTLQFTAALAANGSAASLNATRGITLGSAGGTISIPFTNTPPTGGNNLGTENAFIYDGVITGSGSLTLIGVGGAGSANQSIFDFGAASTYAGNTTINDAVAEVDSGATGTGTVQNLLPTTTVLNLVNNGQFNLNQGASNLSVAGLTGDSTGRIGSTNQSAAVTLTVNGSGSYSFPGIIGPVTTAGKVGGTNIVQLAITGTGTQTLTGSNTYGGQTTVSGGGVLSISSTNNLGGNPSSAIANNLTLNGGTLQFTAALAANGSAASLNATRGITLGSAGGTISIPFTNTPPTGGNNLGTENAFIYDGVITGSGSLTLLGVGGAGSANQSIFDFGAASTYAGNTTINDAVAEVDSGATGTGTVQNLLPTTTVLNLIDNGQFNLNQGASNLSVAGLTGDSTGRIGSTNQSAAVTLTVNGSGSYSFPGIIGPVTTAGKVGGTNIVQLAITGTGTQTLAGSNTYGGQTTVSGGGVLSISSTNNLGGNPSSAIANDLTLNGGTLQFTAALAANGSAASLNATRGITLGSGGGTISIPFTNTPPTGGNNLGTENAFIYDGVITGSGSLTLLGVGGAGSANQSIFDFGAASTYTGNTTINDAVAEVDSGATGTGTVQNLLPTTTVLNLVNNGQFNLDSSASNLSVAGLTGDSSGRIGSTNQSTAVTLTVNGSGSDSFPGIIGPLTTAGKTGSAGILQLAMTGTGTQTLGGSCTYSAGTTISAGTLRADGSSDALGTGGVSVLNNATLAGSGTILAPVSLASGGILAPGDGSPGVLSTGNLTFAAGSNFDDTVNGTPAGSFGQVNVTGTVNLNNASLNLTGTRTNHDGDQIILINNDGTDPVVGTFLNLPQNSRVTINGVAYLLTYTGGSGNDVALIDSTPPHAANDNYNAAENVTLSQNAAHGIIADDTAYNGLPLSVYSVDGTTSDVNHSFSTGNGTLTINSDGSFTYVPNHDFVGVDGATFYVASDGIEQSNSATVQFVVAPGVLTATGTTLSANEGASTGTSTVARFTDSAGGDLGEYTASINWGEGSTSAGTVVSDGNGGWLVQAAHTYNDKGSYSAVVSISSNVGGSASATTTATIANVPPTVSIIGTPAGNVAAGSPITLTAGVSDPSSDETAAGFADTWSVTKNSVSFASGSAATFTFTPDDTGTYAVSLTAVDEYGGTGSASAGITANPSIITLSVPGITAVTGQAFTGPVATFTDTNPNTTAGQYTAAITWGDGHSSSGTITAVDGGGFSVQGSNTYAAMSGTGGDALSITVTRDAQHTATASGVATVNSAPTVATPAAATESTDGTYATLSVLGADALGESGLNYTWTTTSAPSGAPVPTFADAADNTAKDTLAFLQQAGSYTFEATMTNAAGLSATSSVTVTVAQVATSIGVTPSSAVIAAATSQQLTASELDQFGNPMATQPTFTWSVETGGEGGTINSSGDYTAGGTAGADAIDVSDSADSLTGQANVSDVTAVPAAPTGLTATAAEQAVVLSWDAGDDAATWNVYRGTSAGGESATPIATGLTDPYYTDTGRTDGTTYYYTVEAVNPLGTGSASSEANAAPAKVAPTDLVAAPGDHEIDLSWDAAIGATSYNLYRSTTAGGEGTTPFQTGLTEAGYSDPQTTSTTYYYTVTAVYPSGEGAQSTESSAAAELAAPTAPSGLTATANGSNEIDLAWSAGSATASDPVDEYVIERSTDGSTFSEYDDVAGSATTYHDTGASDGTTYYYEVYASNAVGNSTATSSASASTLLAAPDELTATAASGTEIDLTWENNSTSATGFTIERSAGGGAFAAIGTADATATTYNDTGLSPGTDYTYEVVATTSSESSAPSASNDAVTLPSSLSGLTATAGSSSEVDLAWTDVTGATGYEIDRKGADGNWEEIGAVDAPAAGYADTGLDDGTAYTYQVIPYNDSGDADGSNPSASATTSLLAPANVDAVALSSTRVEIVWDNQSSNETGFQVQRSTDGNNFTNLGSTAAGTTDYTDSTAAASTEYWYRVESTNSAAGSSAPSAAADATAPATPVSDGGPATPTLTANPVSSSEIDLTTAAPTDGSHLELEEQGPNDANFSVVSITPTSSDGTLTYAVAGLTATTYYSFRLRADLNGLESYSTAASAITSDTDSVNPAIPVPYNLTATPAAAGSGAGLDLTFRWDGNPPQVADEAFTAQNVIIAPRDPYGAIGYNNTIESIDTASYSNGQVTASTSNSYPGFQVEVRVRSDATGAGWSDWVSATEGGPLMLPPTNLTVVAAGGGQLTATWDAPNDPNYNDPFYQLWGVNDQQFLQVQETSGTTLTFTPLPGVTKYFVLAENDGYSPYSNYAYAPGQSAPTPVAPTSLAATPYGDSSGSGIRLLWDNDSDNETGFTIQRSTSADFSTDLQTFTVAADVTSYVDAASDSDSSVQSGTTYYYQVEANGSDSDSGFSNTANAVVTLPTVSVTAVDPDVDADPEDGYLEVSRTGDDTAALTATLSYAGSTAIAGDDYSGVLPTTVTFAAGQENVVVEVPPANGSPDLASMIDATVADGTGYTAATGLAQFDVAPHGFAVTLGNGSDNVILQGSSDGRSNLSPLALTFPGGQAPGTTLTLSATNSAIQDVWTTENPASNAQPLQWGSNGSLTWTFGSNDPPTALYVGATGGSTRVNDIKFTMSMANEDWVPVANFPTTVTVQSNPATAVKVTIDALTNPNGAAIGANGDVTDLTRNWLVGQTADLGVSVQEPLAWQHAPPTAIQWSVPGSEVYFNYQFTTQRAETTPLLPDNGQFGLAPFLGAVGTEQPEVRWFWGGLNAASPGFESDVVSLSLQIQGITFNAQTTFNVYSPGSSWNASLGSVGITAKNQFGLIANPQAGQLYGSDVTGAVYGNNLAPVGLQGGTFFGTQIITSRLYVGLSDGTTDHRTNNDERVLDTQLEMGTNAPPPWVYPANGIPHHLYDSPHVGVVNPPEVWASRDDLFQDYLMYTPPGFGSHPVALQELSFRWGGGIYFSKQALRWRKDPAHPWYATPPNPTGASTTEPQWSAVTRQPIQFLTASGSIDNRLRP